MTARAAVVVPAAGSGRRMGGVRKAYLELAGEPILVHALRPFLAHPAVGAVVVALPPEDVAHPPAWLTALDPRIRVVAGGEERGDSVRSGLAAVPEDAELVLVHDAARPLVDRGVIDRVLAAAARGVGAVPGIPVADTIKTVDASGEVTGTLDRGTLRAVQTPQAFPRELLVRAYEEAAAAGVRATDCAALVERAGGRVVVVDGSPENFKVTTPEDARRAAAILAERTALRATEAGPGSGREPGAPGSTRAPGPAGEGASRERHSRGLRR